MNRVLAIVSVLGRDQKGVVARISTYLADQDINIEDIEQRVVRGQFLMDMLVDITGATVSLDELVVGLLAIGREIDMEIRVTLHNKRERPKVGVLVSKESHCLEQLITDHRAGLLHGDLVTVVGNHEDLRPVAESAGIPFAWRPSDDKDAHEAFVVEELGRAGADVVVLARYMQILTPTVVGPYAGRIINIHPSLLPYFPGANPYRRAWEDGVRVTGCTAHFVTEELDAGPIILQDVFHIEVGVDSVEDVRRKGRALEGVVLSRALQLYLNNEVVVINGKVVFKPGMRTLLRDFGGTE
ncbi:MAG: formyltetrahydrofolate deformylase [Dehalococcoidia bacterium]|uniref:formyltetrahydrofolate deformylase n=1 Tax=Candidatus Amarobacter glycogenicus TaxID=3140699 RepID=UPI002A0AE611|nr:formyltetrahydrofolate deformylase [Dehalococcoidia bacterium]MBK7125291.1 formyltetrahydrofolate deformylase [Dehalococcoidia bacterium]MBK9545400.1 formyltetrahydrofolate deformylase [Dehalococcoidia bacterium]MBK9611876.1 formyltetrahydrofolate deformylase [Dehalococcoidia bacterium]